MRITHTMIAAGWFCIVSNVFASATTLVNFSQLVAAIESGNNVRAIIHFDRCVFTRPELVQSEILRISEAIQPEIVRPAAGIRSEILRPTEALQSEIVRLFDGASTRFNFNHFFHVRERFLDQFRDTVTTSMKISIPQASGNFVVVSGQLRVFEDNTASVHLDYADSLLLNQNLNLHWRCDISNGQDNNGLVLFDLL